MRLRLRVLAWFLVTTVTGFVLYQFTLSGSLMRDYTDLERDFAVRDTERARLGFHQLSSDLHVLGADWADWDDTYRFMVAPDKEFVESNLVEASLESLEVDLVLLIDTAGRVHHSETIKRTPGIPEPSAQRVLRDLLPALASGSVDRERGVHGVIDQPGAPLLFTIRPIRTTKGKGPSRGWIVFGRYFGPAMCAQLGERTRLALSAYAIGPPGRADLSLLPADCAEVIRDPAVDGAPVTRALNEHRIAGYVAVRDLYDLPLLLLRMEEPRSIFAAGRRSAATASRLIVVAGIVFGAVTLLWLEFAVLARLSSLNAQAGGLDERASGPGLPHDEIAGLAARVNSMVGTLRANARRISENEAQLVQSAKLASLGTLSAGVAHELNQPLMVIRGTAQMLLNEPELPEPALEDLRTIERQTGRMMAIIEHMRGYCRGGSAEMTEVSLNSVVQDCFKLIGVQLRSHNISVELDLDPELPHVVGHPYALEQVLVNLLTNARDALEGRDDATIRIRTYVADRRAVLEVGDNGPGIPECTLERIFDPFFTTKDPGRGTGLGLSISHDIIAKHGGEIRAWNDGGACFQIALPLEATADTRAEAALAA